MNELDIWKRVREATHVYIGVAPCGCVGAMATDLQDKDTAEFCAGQIKDGNIVERVTREDGHARFSAVLDCPHTPKWGKPKS